MILILKFKKYLILMIFNIYKKLFLIGAQNLKEKILKLIILLLNNLLIKQMAKDLLCFNHHLVNVIIILFRWKK
jgi:hypothetical protein